MGVRNEICSAFCFKVGKAFYKKHYTDMYSTCELDSCRKQSNCSRCKRVTYICKTWIHAGVIYYKCEGG